MMDGGSRRRTRVEGERQGCAGDRSTEDRTLIWQEIVGEHPRIQNKLWNMVSRDLAASGKGRRLEICAPVKPACDITFQS